MRIFRIVQSVWLSMRMVVNLQYVRSIRNYKVELRSGVELNASRQDFPAIRSAWLEWKGQFGDE